MIFPITPVPKPRMTRSDKWKKRDCVLRYWAFCDEVLQRMCGVDLDSKEITFHLPMPKSWSAKRREAMNGEPHRSRPDLDNLIKALGDALYNEDAHIADITARKRWAEQGAIEIK